MLFTRALSRVMGYQRQAALYGYYLVISQVLRATSPPLALMTAQETALGGAFRAAHQRLVANAEEVAVSWRGRCTCLQRLIPLALPPLDPPAWLAAHPHPASPMLQFNDPPAGMSEQMILNQHLYRLLHHSRLSAFQQFVQQSLDGFFVKARPEPDPSQPAA